VGSTIFEQWELARIQITFLLILAAIHVVLRAAENLLFNEAMAFLPWK